MTSKLVQVIFAMPQNESGKSWHGKSIDVAILYSQAGVAQQIWISTEIGAILCDAGDGTIRDILANDLDIKMLSAIIVTHGHFDHVGGLHPLLGYLRMVGRKEPLVIIVPTACREATTIVNNFIDCYRETLPFTIEIRELKAEDFFHVADMMISPYPVVHCGRIKGHELLDQIPAYGYRISCKGETIAISGDTGLCPALKNLVKGADLAILEATFKTSKGKTKESLEKVHLSEEAAKELGKSAKNYILIHRVRQ